MSVLEPALILYPVLERAVPSLEALIEVGLKYSLSDYFLSSHPLRRLKGRLLSSKPLERWPRLLYLVMSTILALSTLFPFCSF